MKKIIHHLIFTLIITMSIGITHADFISNSVSIKRLENVSFGDDITVSGNSDIFNIRMNIIPNSSEPNNDFKVILSGLPNNLTASGYTINSDTCSTNIQDVNSQDNTFIYTYTPNGGSPCNAIVTANYITNNTSNGDYNISYTLQNLTDDTLQTSNNSVNLEVNNLIRIIKAQSLDIDLDGYIDGYNITLNQDIGLNIIDVSNLVISDNDNTATNLVFTKTGDDTATISFDDNIFHSGNTPDLNITSIHNSFDSDIYNLGVIEDNASPYLSTINNIVYNGGTTTITTIPGTLEFNFIEPLREADISGLVVKLSSSNISGILTLNTDKNTIIFTPDTVFSQGNYTVEFNNQVIDIAGNIMGLANATTTLGTPPTGSPSSSGGRPSIDNTNYEIQKYLTKIHTKISRLKSGINELVGTLNLDESNILTSSGETIELRVNNKSVSNVKIFENTHILNHDGEQNNVFYPVIQLDESDIITKDFIIINDQEIIPGEVAGLYEFNPNLNIDSSLNNPVEIELLLKRVASFYPVHIYHLNNLDDGWKRIDDRDYIMDSETNTITFSSDTFGYYIIIQNKYLEENPKKISELGETEINPDETNNETLNFINLEEKLNEKLQISAIEKLAHKFYLKFEPNMSYFEYFNSFDIDIVKQYNSYAQAHYNMFVALEQYVLTKDISEKNKVITNLKIIAQAFSAEKDLKTKYITVINNYFVPNNDLIEKATTGLRTKIEKKLNTLVTTNSITQEEYNTAKSSYNDFILHLTIFFEYDKLETARIQALTQARIFIPIYNKKIISQESVISIPENIISEEKEDDIFIETPIITEKTNSNEVKQRVYGDVYYFDNELQFDNYNEDVTHLQKILLREGYFDYATTGYYGEITAQAVKQFASDKLGLDVSGNVFTRDIINGLLAQPMK